MRCHAGRETVLGQRLQANEEWMLTGASVDRGCLSANCLLQKHAVQQCCHVGHTSITRVSTSAVHIEVPHPLLLWRY